MQAIIWITYAESITKIRTPPDGQRPSRQGNFTARRVRQLRALFARTNTLRRFGRNNNREGIDAHPAKRAMGVEPTQTAWKAVVLPLHHARTDMARTSSNGCQTSAADWGADCRRPEQQEPAQQAWTGKDLNLRRRKASRFTVCPLWPLGYPSSNLVNSQPTEGLEPPTCGLQNHCSAN